jgi:hypothetical protein
LKPPGQDAPGESQDAKAEPSLADVRLESGHYRVEPHSRQNHHAVDLAIVG